jgi:4-amino-4-deoxy-L-arabinose transferase-like glycosyltransferase
MKQKIFRSYAPPVILIVLLLLPHLFFWNNGYVDLERYCVQAGSAVASHGFAANLAEYFSIVANPIFSVLLLAGSYRLFGESPMVSRLTIFVLSLVFSLFLYYYLRKKAGGFTGFIATLLVIVNPMFIIYSQYVYSDVPFMIFISVALVLLLFDSSLKGGIISAIMLGLSLATKYVAAIFFPVALIFSIIKSGLCRLFSRARLFSWIRFNLWYFVLAFLISVPLILIVLRYQAGIFPATYESELTLDATMFPPRFFSYLLWLGLFIGPCCVIILIDLWEKAGRKLFLMCLAGAIVLTLVVNVFFPLASLHVQAKVFGEMNLGWVETVVPSPLLSLAFFLVLLVTELFIAGMVLELKYPPGDMTWKLLFWTLLPLVLMSFTRVANRYMLAVLVPLAIYIAQVIQRMCAGTKRLVALVILGLHVLIFISVGFYSNYYLYHRGLEAVTLFLK